jgi:hypothetical protein
MAVVMIIMMAMVAAAPAPPTKRPAARRLKGFEPAGRAG